MNTCMNIRKDNIIFDRYFPFNISDGVMPPGYNMGGMYHWHDCLEISYVKTGRGRYYIEDKIYEIGPGDIMVFNNIEPHCLEVYDEEMVQPVIVFEPVFVWSNSGNSMDYDYLKPFFERGTDFNNKLDLSNPLVSEIKANLTAIEQEFFQKPEGFHLMIKARLLMILTYLIRYFRDRDKTVSNSNKRQNLVKIEEALKFISQHYNHDIKLDEVASKIYMSPQYFCTFFKKVTGATFIDYVNNMRINHALKLLRETGYKITYIATECGFNNTTNFNSAFRKFTGRTPSDFRQGRQP